MALRRASHLFRWLELPLKENETHPSTLMNNDIKPIEKARRTWGWAAFVGFWSTAVFSMTSFQVGSSMMAVGLNWWQIIIATLFGHIITVFLVMLASWPGLEYAIPFPIVTRSAWGLYGTVFVVLNRILLSVIWSGVQSWQGGLMMYICLRAIWPSIDNIKNTLPASTGTNLPQFVAFIVFFVLQLPLLLLNPRRLKYLVLTSGILGFIVNISLTIWSTATMGPSGFGTVLGANPAQAYGSSLGWAFVFCIGVVIASITSGTVSICDYTRFGKSVKSGLWGQFLSWIPGWLGNIFGILTVAATQKRFGAELWSVTQLLTAIQNVNPTSGTRVAVFFCGFAFLSGQFGLNVSGNTFSGGTDMSSLLPKYINIRRGQFITVLLGLIINPWYLVSGATIFLSAMSGYTVFLQPFLGIMVAHYFVVFRQKLQLPDLYATKPSIYYYNKGVNWRSIVAWIFGSAPHVAGFIHQVNPKIHVSKGASEMYYLVSFTGFFISFAVSSVLAIVFPVQVQQDFLKSLDKEEAIRRKEEYILTLDPTFEAGTVIIGGERISTGELDDSKNDHEPSHVQVSGEREGDMKRNL